MAERTLPGLGLTGFWDLGQDEWNTGMDANIRVLSAVAQLSVISATTALPGSPADGDIYIVPSGGNANEIAIRDLGAWVYIVPQEGWRAWVRDTDKLVIWSGSAWTEFEAGGGGGGEGEFDAIGINADADLDDRLFVKSDGIVFSHDDVTPGTGDVIVKINKSTGADDAGFALSTNWVVRALMGLMGDNNFSIRTSADGSGFSPAVHIDTVTGHVGLGTAGDAGNRLVVKGTSALFDAETDDFRFVFSKKTSTDDAAMVFQSNYSGRALIGLLGSDDFVFTVSPDGSAYEQALVIDKDTALVDFPKNAKFSATVNYDAYIPVDTWTKIPFNDTDYNDQAAFDAGDNEFVAPVAGLYQISAKVNYKWNAGNPTGPSDPVTDAMHLRARVNGTAVDRSLVRNRNSWGMLDQSTQLSVLLWLEPGDTVDIQVFMAELDAYVEANTNFFSGFRVA